MVDRNFDRDHLKEKWSLTKLLEVESWDNEKKKKVSVGLEKVYRFIASIAPDYENSEKVAEVVIPAVSRIAQNSSVNVENINPEKLVDIADKNISLDEEDLVKKVESEYTEYIEGDK